MDASDELVRRLSLKRSDKLGHLSPEGFAELERSVSKNPSLFVDDEREAAFLEVGKALARMEDARDEEENLDDDAYLRARRHHLDRLVADCDRALSLDPGCVDAKLLRVLAADQDPNEALGLLLELQQEVEEQDGPLVVPDSGDAWDDVFSRPRLRLDAAVARTCFDGARYRLAESSCRSLIEHAPSDVLGARLTCSLALARLEDEKGLNALDVRFRRAGNAWMHLSRALLMFKLDRLGAAQRAIMGFANLCEGGAYLLAHPTYVDIYLPDRPSFKPGSFEESLLAVHEADPIVVDTPDFVAWASTLPGFVARAQGFDDGADAGW
jgi:hypothetical protein